MWFVTRSSKTSWRRIGCTPRPRSRTRPARAAEPSLLSVDVFVANEQEREVDAARLSRLATHVLQAEDVDEAAELSVLLVGSDHIRKLNARFAGDDYATDVLSFPMMEDDESS